ncbi:hypothetical protein HA402_004417 [Bradysia odoriphaga]|nr:hypothetical protein HA402_004417 [Bradysia odoriphaga]
MSITQLLRNKISIGNSFWNEAANKMESINQGRTVIGQSRIVPGNKLLTTPSVSNIRTLARTFTTSSRDNNYDFPILPIPSKSRSVQLLRKTVPPIAPSFMPSTITSTRNKSEKVYRRIRNTCRSLVTDLMYSFPFNTHSERTKEVMPTLPIGELRDKSANLISDKLVTKPRNSIWSITDNFSFPNIHRRFEIESLEVATNGDDDNTEENASTNTSIAEI